MNHRKWAADIEETQGHKVKYPMIGDPELKVANSIPLRSNDNESIGEATMEPVQIERF